MNACCVNAHGELSQCAACVKPMEDFILNYGVSHMILNTTFDDPGHRWVRSMDDVSEPDPDILYWCAWCGVHRVEVENWKEKPECPAVADAKKLIPTLGKK